MASWAAWSTKRGIFPKSARSRCRPWPRTCRTASRRRSLPVTPSPSSDRFRRASSNRAAGSSIRSTPAREKRTTAWSRGTRRSAALADTLKATAPARSFFYASGRSSNEAGFVLQLLARAFGTNNVNNCSYYCHQASGVGLAASLGSGTATVQLEDVEGSDLFVLIGGNPASNHPRLLRSLMAMRRRGGHVIVINPAKEIGLVNFRVPSDPRSLMFGSRIASLYVQPHIGGDLALLTGVAKHVLERGGQGRAFIEQHTEGFAAFKQQVESTTWGDIEASAGVSRETIARMAEMYMSAKQRGDRMDDGHHAPSARSRERADDCQPGAACAA